MTFMLRPATAAGIGPRAAVDVRVPTYLAARRARESRRVGPARYR
jgi:hypothetical protein